MTFKIGDRVIHMVDNQNKTTPCGEVVENISNQYAEVYKIRYTDGRITTASAGLLVKSKEKTQEEIQGVFVRLEERMKEIEKGRKEKKNEIDELAIEKSKEYIFKNFVSKEEVFTVDENVGSLLNWYTRERGNASRFLSLIRRIFKVDSSFSVATQKSIIEYFESQKENIELPIERELYGLYFHTEIHHYSKRLECVTSGETRSRYFLNKAEVKELNHNLFYMLYYSLRAYFDIDTRKSENFAKALDYALKINHLNSFDNQEGLNFSTQMMSIPRIKDKFIFGKENLEPFLTVYKEYLLTFDHRDKIINQIMNGMLPNFINMYYLLKEEELQHYKDIHIKRLSLKAEEHLANDSNDLNTYDQIKVLLEKKKQIDDISIDN